MKQYDLLEAGDLTGKPCNPDNDLCALDPISEQDLNCSLNSPLKATQSN